MTTLQDLVKEQDTLQHEFLQDQLLIQGHSSTPISSGTATYLKGRLDAWYPKMDVLRKKILDKAYNTSDYDKVSKDLGFLQVAFTTTMGKLLDIIQVHSQRGAAAQAATPTAPPTPTAKLPDLVIPTFTGNIQEWMAFSDMFKTVVHNNTRLSNSARLHYLKAALKDEPLHLISAIPVTDGNYSRAWTMLTDRYQHSRKIVTSLVLKLVHLPPAHSGKAKDLRKLVDANTEIIQQLRELQQPVDQWDALLTAILGEKIDEESSRTRKRTLSQAIPSFVDMVKFLNDRIDADLDAEDNIKKKTRTHEGGGKKKVYSNHGKSESPARKCQDCQEAHHISQCKSFQDKSYSDRSTLIRSSGLCFNCLARGHSVKECPSKFNCRRCSARHHTLLHKDDTQSSSALVSEAPLSQTGLHVTDAGRSMPTKYYTLLATAMVQIPDPKGNLHMVRALLDGGSQVSCITEQCATRLQLKREATKTEIFGLQSASTGTSTGIALFSIRATRPEISTLVISVAAVIVKNITGNHPTCNISSEKFTHLQGLPLADKTFDKSTTIDVLLGADAYEDIMLDGKIKGPPGTPTAFNTIFGWMVMGKVWSQRHSSPTSRAFAYHLTTADVDKTLQRFWQLEELTSKVQSPEEKECEQHFQTTHSRDDDGRYRVRLPFKHSHPQLGLSRKTAYRRWLHQEARLKRDQNKKQQYFEFMQTMIQMGHMQPNDQQHVDGPSTFYIPHHAVINEASTSTRLRVVFDALCKSAHSVSLNDTLMTGPWVQDELIDHLLRFRMHRIALVSDIVKMFRQVAVSQEDWDYQRILWRSSENSPVLSYWLTTAVYSQARSPYLATRALNQLAIDEADQFPRASQIVLRDFYADNYIGGADSIKLASELITQLSFMLRKGQLPLKKWMSNSEEVLQQIPAKDRETESFLTITDSETMKTLGIQWNPRTDDFVFVVTEAEVFPCTKRTILSDIAKVFDPLGWIAPVTVVAKQILQSLWAEQVEWDSQLPPALLEQWTKYRSTLTEVGRIRIPRYVRQPLSDFKSQFKFYTLHGFVDASEKAYAAALYIVPDEGPPQLMIAKTKVAPVKRTTLPRLELCAAHLLSKLVSKVTIALKKFHFHILDTYAWTDSTIVLAWISSNANRWTTFVGNRVAQIQEIIPASKWNHVRSEENPADAASRGISPIELQHSTLWWHGPSWLSIRDMTKSYYQPQQTQEEERRTLHHITTTADCPSTVFLNSFSLLSKLLRISVHIRMQLFKSSDKGSPSVTELHEALKAWIKQVQETFFGQDIAKLREKGQVSKQNKLVCLCPFLDSQGILRVNGRIAKYPVCQDQRQPILLPKSSHLTKLLIQREHHRLLHAGPQQVRASLQLQYWIPAGQATVRKVTRQCVICTRAKGTIQTQLMGDLPQSRVTPSPPFSVTGVDYAGPFELRVQKVRGQAKYKAYVCVFVCFSTHAIHLELVSDLSTQGFLGALNRFTSQRGKAD